MSKNTIIKSNNEIVDTTTNFMDVYDAQFRVLSFEEINKQKQTEANKVLTDVAKALNDKGVLDSLKKDELEYVVDMPKDVKKAIEDGLLKLDASKDGNIYAQLRINGKFDKKFPIKKIIKEKGIDSNQVANALQTQAIEMQLEEIVTTLNSIEADVDAIKQGQQNDRIALFYSGMNMYLEAKSLADGDMKKYMIAQSLKSISDSNSQVLQQLQSDINYLTTKQYSKQKGKSYKDMQERVANINKAFDMIYQSTMIKAAIYYDQGELSSMLTVFDEYSNFIEKVIIPVSPKLTELDGSIKTLKNGVWEQRAKSISTVENIKHQLETNNSYIMKIEAENNKKASLNNIKIKEVAYYA